MRRKAFTGEKEGGRVRCTLCPHLCLISEGKTGLCQVRVNEGGKLTLPYYGAVAALQVDPIEKKPLYHFHPGKDIFSAGFLSCNFFCPFCQNHHLSAGTNLPTEPLSPRKLAQAATGTLGLAFTYSEPSIHFEYLMDTAREARELGLATVLITNGHLEKEPARALLSLMDAVNVDLKAFDPDYYKKVLKGSLQGVMDFIALASELTHTEVTTLLIPYENDSEPDLRGMAGFLASLSRDIPYHISAYYPARHYNKPAATEEEIIRAVEIAGEYLNYIYPGNVGWKPRQSARDAEKR